MTYPRDYRQMPTHEIQNDIRNMNTGRLDDMLSAIDHGEQRLPPGKDVIERELDQRNHEQMAAAAQHALEEEKSLGALSESDLQTVEQLETVEEIGTGVNKTNLPTEPVDPDSITKTLDSANLDGAIGSDTDIKPEVAKQVLDRIVGAIVMEALLMERCSSILYDVCEESHDIMILSQETTGELIRHLWESYSPDERAQYLVPIFDRNEEDIISIVLELGEEAGLGVEHH